MPDQQLTNPTGAFGYDGSAGAGNRPADAQQSLGVRVVPMVNASTLTAAAHSAVFMSTVAVSTTALMKFVQPASGSATAGAANLIGVVNQPTEPGSVGDVVVEGVTLVAVSTTAIPTILDLLGSSTVASIVTTLATQSVTGLLKTSTSTGVSDGVVIAQALSSTLDASSSTSVGSYIYAYVHKM